MDPTLVPGTRFESQFQICVYEHAILRIYISFFFPTQNAKKKNSKTGKSWSIDHIKIRIWVIYIKMRK